MTFNKDAFLAPPEVNGPFPVEGFGEVYVREIACADAGFLFKSSEDDLMDSGVRAVIVSVCDAEGNRLFTDDDYERLKGIPAKRIQALAEVANRHSGIADDVDAIAGNSETTT